jgi:hypothetical protein
MPWFRVDDGFWGHPKRLGLPYSAIGLWTVAGSWVARNLTDGHVPRAVLTILSGTRKDAAALVQAGLWVEHEDGWMFKDWDHYQKTKAQIERDREAARKRMGKARNGFKEVELEGEQEDDVTPDVRANIDRSDASSSTSQSIPGQAKPSQSIPTNNYLEGEPPSPHCSKHPEGTEAPCGPCGTARLKFQAWTTTAAEMQNLEKQQRQSAANNCPNRCVNGWIEDEENNPVRKCYHMKGTAA